MFGPDLQRVGHKACAMPAYHGQASLDCFEATWPQLSLITTGSRLGVRMTFCNGQHEFNVPVTDIRPFENDHVTPSPTTIVRTARHLESTGQMILSVGLGRRFKRTAAEPARH